MVNHWSVIAGFAASIVVIGTGIWGVGHWWHKQVVEAVSDRLKSIDDAVNHRKDGEPRLVEMVEETLAEMKINSAMTNEVRVDMEKLNAKVERHLGWHEGVNQPT